MLLLLHLWENGKTEADNRVNSLGTSAPLVPFLRRMSEIPCSRLKSEESDAYDEVSRFSLNISCFANVIVFNAGFSLYRSL